jgi:hypothetical protein
MQSGIQIHGKPEQTEENDMLMFKILVKIDFKRASDIVGTVNRVAGG